MGEKAYFSPYAILTVLVTATAFVLSFLCVFAGNTPGMMESYSVFTLNTTRLGQNAVEKIDNKILGFNVTKIITKRDIPAAVEVHPSMITAAPTLIDARGLDDIVSDLTAGAASIKSNADSAVDSVQTAIESKVTSIKSAAESGISSIEGVVASKISSAIGSAQTAVVDAVNGTYNDWIDELNLKVRIPHPSLLEKHELTLNIAGLLLYPHAHNLRGRVYYTLRPEHLHRLQCLSSEWNPQACRLVFLSLRPQPSRSNSCPLRNRNLLHWPGFSPLNLDHNPLPSAERNPRHYSFSRSSGFPRKRDSHHSRSLDRCFKAIEFARKWDRLEDRIWW